MRMHKKLAILFLLCSGFASLYAQETPASRLIARSQYRGDSVVLRWAFDNELAWKLAQESGYIVERAETGSPNPRFQRIAGPIKPWPAERIAARYNATQDRNAGIALATLYGNTALEQSQFTLDNAVEMARLFRMRFAYNLLAADLNAGAAQMSGLRFSDLNVSKGKTYAYRIYAPIDRQRCKTDTALIFVNTSQADPAPETPELKLNQGDGKLELVWKYLRSDFSAFQIERSDHPGGPWKRLSQIPYVVIEKTGNSEFIAEGRFGDTGLRNYQVYQYRLVGITPFGEAIAFEKSIAAYPKDMQPPAAAQIKEITQGESQILRLSWNFEGNRRELKSYKIGRSDQADGQYIEISKELPPDTYTYIDSSSDAEFGNYYVVYAMDTAGNVSVSLPKFGFLKDNLPPPTPQMVKAEMDTTGKVTLIWRPSAARDLMGYRLYTANDPEHEFGLVSGDIITDSFYFDSLTVWTLSKYRYYRIAALDLAYNASPLSAIIPVRRPDLIPPVAPAVLELQSDAKGQRIRVLGSESEDVQRQYLELRAAQEVFRLPFQAKAGQEIMLTDTLSKAGIAYEIRAYAVDSSGNTSSPSPVVYSQSPISHADNILDFRGRYNADSGVVQLDWQLKQPVKMVAVYRSRTDEIPELIQQVSGQAQSFIDTKAAKGQTLVYCIKLLDSDYTVFSKMIEIRIPD